MIDPIDVPIVTPVRRLRRRVVMLRREVSAYRYAIAAVVILEILRVIL